MAGWHDRKIMPGAEWKGQISKHIETSQIILLLISAGFLHSDYSYDLVGNALWEAPDYATISGKLAFTGPEAALKHSKGRG